MYGMHRFKQKGDVGYPTNFFVKQQIKKISSVLFSVFMGTAMVAPSIPVSAQDQNNDTQTQTTVKASDADEQANGKIAVKIDSGAGTVKVTTSDGKTQSVTTDEAGKATVTKTDGSQAEAKADKDGYLLTADDTAGKQVTVEALSAKGYKVSTYKVTSDAGTVVKKNDETDVIKAITLNKDTTAVVETAFDKQQDSTATAKETTSSDDKKQDASAKDAKGRYKVADNVVIDSTTSKVVDKLIASGESQKQAWKDAVNPGTKVSKKVKAKLSAANINGESSFSADGIFSATFVVHDGNKSYTGFCIEAAATTPIHYGGAYNKVTVQANNFNAKMATAILAYGVGGEHSDFIARIIPNAGQQKVAMMQALRQYAQGGHDQTVRKAYTNNFINAIKTQVVDKGLIADTSYYYVWNANGYQNVAAGYSITPPEGYVTAQKSSSNTSITSGNAQYSLDGAEYRIYSDQACTKYTDKGFHFDANGSNTWGVQKLTPGTYYAKEYKAPKGYNADTTVHSFNVTSGNTTSNPVKVNISEQPSTTTIQLQKSDLETGKTTPQKGTANNKATSFEDAEYTFTYSDGAKKTYTWVMKTDKNGVIKWDDDHYVSGDKLLKDNGKAVLPLGTLTYKESKAPVGYVLDTETHTINLTAETATSGKAAQVDSKESIMRSNVYFSKTRAEDDSTNGETMKGIYFRITNVDTGESHVVKTDATGKVNTADKDPSPTAQTACWIYNYNSKTKTGSVIKDSNGQNKFLWFGEGTPNASKGSLTYGTYKIQELPTAKGTDTKGNIGKDLAEGEFTAASDTTEALLIKSGKNGTETFVNYTVKLQSEASTDGNGEQTAVPGVTKSIKDKVSYVNLTPGREYTLRSVVIDRNDATGDVTGVDGKAYKKFAETTTTFKASKDTINKETGNSDGSVSVTIPIDSSKMQEGHTYVVFEYLSYGDMEEQQEIDAGDAKQSITPLYFHTTATDGKTKDEVATVGKTETIVDKVAYSGLTVGKTYTVSGYLVDKATGEAIKDKDGKKITQTKTFKAEHQSGSVDLVYNVDSSLLAGKTTVVFEDFMPSSKEVLTHHDINDTPQTVHYPSVKTTAVDGQTKEHVGTVSKKTTLVDTVSYTNLVVGKTYTVKGTLMDKETGKALQVNGKNVTTQTTFKADKVDGTVDMTFTFDSSALAGKTTVVFEDLIHNNVTVATHSDLKDDGQTVHYPGVHTTATDKNTKTHTGAKDKQQTIVDIVKYTNVVAGKTYTISGTLMDKETGKPYTENGKAVTATKTFKAEKAEGEVELDYTVDTSALKEAKTFVVFEDLKYGDVTLVSHADLKDEGQSVNIPSGHTEAADTATNDQVGTVGKKVTTVDHVIYKNLTPGETYTVSGKLMNPETGKPIQDNGKDITATKTFTPKEANGTVDITFTYDSSALKGKTIVIFEDVYSNGIPVIVNEDLKDTNEYIYYPEIHTSASVGGQKNDIKTGQIEITDTVTYKNLIPGKTYDLKGLLKRKDNGQSVRNGLKEVTGETKFTPTKADGTVEVKFNFDATSLGGQTVVVFEDLYHNDKPVTDHHDLNDEAQSVSFAPDSPKTGVNGGRTALIVVVIAAAATVVFIVKKKKGSEADKADKKN